MQRFIEVVIGRLVTDEEFRTAFLRDPRGTVERLLDQGMHLTHLEVAALLRTDSGLWERVAEHVDPRLRKISLKA